MKRILHTRYLSPAWMLGTLLLLGACASTGPTEVSDQAAQPQQVAQDGTVGEPASGKAAPEINVAIDKALNDGWDDLHMIVECFTDKGWQATEIFGNGIAIWNQTKQYQLDEAAIREQLETIRQSSFQSMKELYGGNIKKDEEASALRVTCRVLLDVDGAYKQVAQRGKGEQSEELFDLAAKLLAVCDGPAENSISAENLADGLDKLASGDLAPVTWRVMINRKPDRASGRDGWLLMIEDQTAKSRIFKQGTGFGDPKAVELTETQLGMFLAFLKELDVTALPINLYAEDYTDLSIAVLNHRHKIQARQFAGMTPDKHGEKQKNFDRLVVELEALHKHVMANGEPTAVF